MNTAGREQPLPCPEFTTFPGVTAGAGVSEENGSELHPAIKQLARTSRRVKKTIAVLLMGNP
jgi:hypothetical protein